MSLKAGTPFIFAMAFAHRFLEDRTEAQHTFSSLAERGCFASAGKNNLFNWSAVNGIRSLASFLMPS